MKFLLLLYVVLGLSGRLLGWYGDGLLFQMTGIPGWAFLPAVLWLAWSRRRSAVRKPASGAGGKQRIKSVLPYLERGWAVLACVCIFLVPAWTLGSLFWGERLSALSEHQPSMRLFALTGMLWFLIFSGLIYVRECLKRSPDAEMQSVYFILNGWLGLYFIAAVMLGAEYFGAVSVYPVTVLIIGAFSLLPCLELILRLLGFIFLPRRGKGHSPELFHFYIFEVIANPGQVAGVFRDAWHRQLGLSVAGGQFLQIAGASLLPLLLVSVLIIWLLSGVVVLQPGFSGLVLRFGRPTERVLGEGVHFKAPWPMETIRKMDIWKIRRIRVGSHRPKTEEEELYRTDVPILWTNNHGVSEEELLIVAPPRDMLQQGSTSQKTPSVSLIGADITVEYRVSDLYRYFLAGQDVKTYFEQIAMQISSRALLRYDVDELFCLGRIELPQVLHQELQKAVDRLRLGIAVLHVGLGGVHPPQTVAKDFQSTVAALQKKMTMTEEARQEAINRLANVAGTVELSRRLLQSEKQFNAEALQAEGKVAGILSEARAYRCEKANSEIGKSDRFLKERLLYEAAPAVYLNHRMMSSLEEGLKDSFKYMLIGDRDKMILRFRKKQDQD